MPLPLVFAVIAASTGAICGYQLGKKKVEAEFNNEKTPNIEEELSDMMHNIQDHFKDLLHKKD